MSRGKTNHLVADTLLHQHSGKVLTSVWHAPELQQTGNKRLGMTTAHPWDGSCSMLQPLPGQSFILAAFHFVQKKSLLVLLPLPFTASTFPPYQHFFDSVLHTAASCQTSVSSKCPNEVVGRHCSQGLARGLVKGLRLVTCRCSQAR